MMSQGRERISGKLFSASRLICPAGNVLKIIGLAELGANMKTHPLDPQCRLLPLVLAEIKERCENRSECVIDIGALHLTHARCPIDTYVSIDCYCTEPDFKDEKWKVIRNHSLQVDTMTSKVTAKIPVVRIVQQITTLKQKFTIFRPNNSTMMSDITAKMPNVTAMTSDFIGMSLNVTTMKSNFTQMSSDVTAMTSNVTTMTSNFTVTSNVTKIMSNVTTKTQNVSAMQSITTNQPMVTKAIQKIAKNKTKVITKKQGIIATMRMLYGTMTSAKPSFKHDMLDSLKQKAGEKEDVSKYVFEIIKAPEVAHGGPDSEPGHLGKFIVVVKKEEIDPVKMVSDLSLGKAISSPKSKEKANSYLNSGEKPYIEQKKGAEQQLSDKEEIENEREILLDRIENSDEDTKPPSPKKNLRMGFGGHGENPNAQLESSMSKWSPGPVNEGLDGTHLPETTIKSNDGKSQGLQKGTSFVKHGIVQTHVFPSDNSSLKWPIEKALADQSNLTYNQGPQEAAYKKPSSVELGMLNSNMKSSYLRNDAKGFVRTEKPGQDKRMEDKHKMAKHVGRVRFREKADAAKAVTMNKVLAMNNQNSIEMHRRRLLKKIAHKKIADKNIVRNEAAIFTDDEINFKRRKKHTDALKKRRAFPEKQFNNKIMNQVKHNKRKLAKKEKDRKRKSQRSKTHNSIYGKNYYRENEKRHTKRDNVNGNLNSRSNVFRTSMHGWKQKLGERKLKSAMLENRKLRNKGNTLRDKKYMLHHHRHLGNKQWLSERHWDKSLLEIGKHDSGHLNRFQKHKIGHKVKKNEHRKLGKLRREITKRTRSLPDQVLHKQRQRQDRNKKFSTARQSLKRFRKDKAETKGYQRNFYQNRQKKRSAKRTMRHLLKKFENDKAETNGSKQKFDKNHSHDYLKKKLSMMYKVAVQNLKHKTDLIRPRESSNRQYRDQNSPASKVAVYNLIDKPVRSNGSTVEHIPAIERSELFCANNSCPLTIVRTLGFPTVEFNQAKDIIAVVRHGLFTPLPLSIMNLKNNLHKKQKEHGPVSCKKIKQKGKHLNGLDNWRICYFKGPLSGRMMDMIRNNYFIIVTRKVKGQKGKLIAVQKDDERVTREIIRRIVEGEARRKRDKSLVKCPLDSCKNGGTCLHLANGTKACVCGNDFAGSYCEYDGKLCSPSSARCQNNGSCRLKNDGATYGCSCEPGYSGTFCQQRLRQCSAKILNCLNGGTCVEDETARCLCTSQFTGPSCESKQIILCAANPCHSSSMSCVDKPNGFLCTCPPGRKGERCELSADLCPSNPSPCKNSGICVPSANDSHTCICDASHYGPSCESTFVGCGANDPCLNGGTCFVHHANKPTVTSSATDDYHCVCSSGYGGDRCETRFDVCLKSTPCQNGGDCKMADNKLGFVCVCKAPYQGDHCEQTASGPVSQTLLVLGGKKGTCERNRCQNGGSCYKSTDGRDVCICLRGFGGAVCENWQDVCMSGPCLNGGTCYNIGRGQFKCTCLDGYTGFNCQRVQSACTPTTCQNNGVCRPSKVESGYVCICAEGYGGISCDVHDPCLSHPCQNGAGCKIHSEGTRFQCECPTGFTGDLCQNRNITMKMLDSGNSLGPCFSVPCLHGGTCKETVNRTSYECICLPGVKGRLCEKDAKDECKSQPCLNGAICKNLPGKFECHCPYGLEGITCEKKLFIDPCDQKPCQNGGLCKMISTSAFDCLCPTLFTGPNCSIHTAPCQQPVNPCPIGKKCAENPASFHLGYICVDEKIQSNPSAAYSWKFINSDNISLMDNNENIQLAQPIVATPEVKKSGLGTIEIVAIICVVGIVIFGLFLLLIFCRVKHYDTPENRPTYRPIANTKDSWDNIFSFSKNEKQSKKKNKFGELEDAWNNENLRRQQQPVQSSKSNSNDDQVLGVNNSNSRVNNSNSSGRNANNSAGSYVSAGEQVIGKSLVHLVQPESEIPFSSYAEFWRGSSATSNLFSISEDDRSVAASDPERNSDASDAERTVSISSANRYALLNRIYVNSYQTPQLLITPPRTSNFDSDELRPSERLFQRRRRISGHSDGYLSVKLYPCDSSSLPHD